MNNRPGFLRFYCCPHVKLISTIANTEYRALGVTQMSAAMSRDFDKAEGEAKAN